MYKDILVFSYDYGVETEFYPYDTAFTGSCEIDGSTCHYVHDYYPTRIQKIDVHPYAKYLSSAPVPLQSRCSGSHHAHSTTSINDSREMSFK